MFVEQHAEQIVIQLAKSRLKTQKEAVEYLGRYFRSPLASPDSKSDYDIGMALLKDHIFCHLEELDDKFHLLIHMIQKLFAFVITALPKRSRAVFSAMLNAVWTMWIPWQHKKPFCQE